MDRFGKTESLAEQIHAAQQDPRFFEALIAPYQNRIYSICLRMAGNEQDANDMAQEALIRIYKNLSRYRGEAQFGTWVWRVTTNVCLDCLRRNKRNSHVSTEEMEDAGQLVPASSGEGPENRLETKERLKVVADSLRQLKEEYRVPIVLRDVDGRSYDEIAEILNLNLNTVKTRILRGRMQLRELLLSSGWFPERTAGMINSGEEACR